MRWYAAILAEAERVKAYPPGEDREIEDVAVWLQHQVGPSVALMYLAEGGGSAFFDKLAVDAKVRLKKAQQNMLERYFRKLQEGTTPRDLSQRLQTGGASA